MLGPRTQQHAWLARSDRGVPSRGPTTTHPPSGSSVPMVPGHGVSSRFADTIGEHSVMP